MANHLTGGVNDAPSTNVFCGLSLHHHPQLLQSLPAKLQADLKRQPDFVALNSEIESLSMKTMAATMDDERQQVQDHRNELYWRACCH